jgi:transposase
MITRAEAEELAVARKSIRDKQTDKRFRAVQMRGEGESNAEIAVALETSAAVISTWVQRYVKGGIEALYDHRRGGNRRNMSMEEEKELLDSFEARAEEGQVIEVSQIEAAYVEKVGHSIGSGQIYRVLKRHEWRKILPRSRHPKKASEEEMEASKKLTLDTRN